MPARHPKLINLHNIQRSSHPDVPPVAIRRCGREVGGVLPHKASDLPRLYEKIIISGCFIDNFEWRRKYARNSKFDCIPMRKNGQIHVLSATFLGRGFPQSPPHFSFRAPRAGLSPFRGLMDETLA
jgi:hypothetical protein